MIAISSTPHPVTTGHTKRSTREAEMDERFVPYECPICGVKGWQCICLTKAYEQAIHELKEEGLLPANFNDNEPQLVRSIEQIEAEDHQKGWVGIPDNDLSTCELHPERKRIANTLLESVFPEGVTL
jgi:hypothetical protein